MVVYGDVKNKKVSNERRGILMKKRLCMIMALTAALTGIFANSVSAKDMAPNTEDKPFSIYLELASGGTGETEWRNKIDKSSTYIFLNDAPSDYTKCDVLGGIGDWDNNDNIHSISTETYGGKAVRVNLGKWRIRQTVGEHGKNKARIRFYRDLQNGVIAGYWSPDCAGNYPSVN